jgi:hypothetical protein
VAEGVLVGGGLKITNPLFETAQRK